MSLSTDYTQILKNIKETEEATNQAIAEKRKKLAEELQLVQEDANKTIATSKAEAEAYVTGEVESAKKTAQVEADKIVASVTKNAGTVATEKLDKSELRSIIDQVLLAELKGD